MASSYGCALYYSTTANGTYTAVPGLISIDPPKLKAAMIKGGGLAAPSNFATMRPGRAEPGEMKFKCDFTSSDFATFKTMFRVGYYWKIVWADSSTQVQAGYISEIDPGKLEEEDNRIETEVTVSMTGPPA